MTPDVLRVRGLSVRYDTPGGAVRAADEITLSLRGQERLGIVGESGSGKSTMALALLRLIKPPGRIEAGEIWLDGVDLMTLSDEEMRRRRLARIALVPQGSMNSLNPVLRVRDQI
ncbi:MAG: dipeptide/oligopeptide/nickel ABC transporter ATP-binding protein, partial [Candidatus Rokuibacteriota bacterium]